MTIPVNAQTTYPTIGNREDLSDEIWKISPTETPFFSAIDKIGTSAVNHEWQTQRWTRSIPPTRSSKAIPSPSMR
jgi:hypothetical protein